MDKEVIVRVAGAEVECSVMRTEEELALGLQGHNDLSEGEGMLFLFPQPKTPTFWMGKVAFPIDIIGIDENSRITKIVEDAQPGTTSRWTFHRVSAVLEVPGRWCLKNGINVGDQVDALDFPKIIKRKIAVDLNDPKLVMGRTELKVNKGFNAVWPQVFGMIYGTYIGKGGVFIYEGAHQPGMADAVWLRQYAEEQQRPEAMSALRYLERMPGTRHRMKGTDGKTLWVTDAELQYFDISKAPDLKGARQRRLEQEMPGETVSERPPEKLVELPLGGFDYVARHDAAYASGPQRIARTAAKPMPLSRSLDKALRSFRLGERPSIDNSILMKPGKLSPEEQIQYEMWLLGEAWTKFEELSQNVDALEKLVRTKPEEPEVQKAMEDEYLAHALLHLRGAIIDLPKQSNDALVNKIVEHMMRWHRSLTGQVNMLQKQIGEPGDSSLFWPGDEDDGFEPDASHDAAYASGSYHSASLRTAGSESYKGINFTPPQGARDAAQAGLNLRKEYGRGGTAVGIARARDIARGAKLSPETMKRMKAFFDRHQKNRGSGSESPPKNGWIAWQLWGGDAGRSWANKVVKQMEARKKKK